MMEANDERCPNEVLDWIAWYPHGEVPEEVRGSIEAHAAECSACREEIALVGGDATVLEDLPPADRVFGRVLRRIAETDADVGSTAVPPLGGGERARPPRRLRRSVSLPQALAAGIALVCISWVGGWLAAGGGPADSAYQAVTDPVAAGSAAEGGVLLDVVFRADVPFGRVQETLQRIDAAVVAGPSRAGVVRLRLPPGTPAAAVATQLREGDDPVALFAEPVPAS